VKKLDLDDTLVFFTSDHGDYAGHRGLLSKIPWISFDDLAKVPLFCVGQGVEGGRRVGALVQSFDFAPTVLDYAGLDVSGFDLDGRSLRPCLQESRPELDTTRVIFSATSTRWPAVRKGTLKYVASRRPPVLDMLFDLARDPGETTDVSARPAYRGEAEHLRALLADCLARTVPDLPRFG
jgi:choline-sulfatase